MRCGWGLLPPRNPIPERLKCLISVQFFMASVLIPSYRKACSDRAGGGLNFGEQHSEAPDKGFDLHLIAWGPGFLGRSRGLWC